MLIRLILFCALLTGAGAARGATIFQQSGNSDVVCCEFGAFAIGWTQASTWTNVQIDLEIYNYGPNGEVQTGVALLLDSLGPGTTPANELEDAIVASTTAGPQIATLWTGLTLDPGTYYVLFYGVSHSFSDFLAVRGSSNPTVQTAGPGVTPMPIAMLENVFAQAGYRPASEYQPFAGLHGLINVTGIPDMTPVPEPSLAVLLVSGVAILAIRQRRRSV